MNFAEAIFSRAERTPGQIAIVLADRVCSWGMIGAGALSAEGRLRALGVGAGSNVGMVMESPIRHLIVSLALYRIGAVCVAASLAATLRASGLDLPFILTDQDLEGPAVRRIDGGWFTDDVELAALRGTCGPAGADDVHRVVFSTGSTGRPKACGFSAKVIQTRIDHRARMLAGTPAGRMLCLPGLDTSFGHDFAIYALASGGLVAFADSALEALQMVDLYGLDFMVAATQQIREMIAVDAEAPQAYATLKTILIGGSRAPLALVEQAQKLLCEDILGYYASTEVGPVAFGSAAALREADGAVGYLAQWAEVEAVDGRKQPLPRGQIGQLRVRSPGQAFAYPKIGFGPAGGADGDWFYPGDQGAVRADGLLVLSGRTSELVNVGGVKVAPELIEEVLLGHSAVADAAAFGVADGDGLETLCACVILDAPAEADEIRDYCDRRAGGARIGHLAIVASIPRANGKILRQQLRDEFRAVRTGS